MSELISSNDKKRFSELSKSSICDIVELLNSITPTKDKVKKFEDLIYNGFFEDKINYIDDIFRREIDFVENEIEKNKEKFDNIKENIKEIHEICEKLY